MTLTLYPVLIPLPSMNCTNLERISLSIVSHGQASIVRLLLSDLRAAIPRPHEIILTLNVPEDEKMLSGFEDLPLHIIRNRKTSGFGSNHNAAFKHSCGDVFVVLNPDIRAHSFDFGPMLESLSGNRVGACGPVVLSPLGSVEDSVRHFPTVTRLARRVVLRRQQADYKWDSSPIEVDWVAGMFMAFRRENFESIGGFDDRFFMYFEDADICRRLRAKGLSTVLQPQCVVVHAARRASRRNLRHLRWHVTSAFRFLTGL